MATRRLLPMTPAEIHARRQVTFVLPDSRGNNPHGTAESAEHEGKRRNAGRYETVGELDRALDVRARLPPLEGNAPDPSMVALSGTHGKGGGVLSALLLIGVGAALAYVVTKSGSRAAEDDDGSDMARDEFARERARIRAEIREQRRLVRDTLTGKAQAQPGQPPVIVVSSPVQNPAPPVVTAVPVIDAEFKPVVSETEKPAKKRISRKSRRNKSDSA